MTTFTVNDSANYAAQIVKLGAPFKHPNADRLECFGILGFTVIAGKGDFAEGDLAVFFPAESQLADSVLRDLNLYRHAEKNADLKTSGYIEDNRRVRAIKLRGTISNGMLVPLEKFAHVTMQSPDSFHEGLVFDTIGSAEICRKYRIKEPAPQSSREAAKLKKAFKRVDDKLFPQHIETDQYLRNQDLLDGDDVLIVTQKLHGTSLRAGRVPVLRGLSWIERVARKLGVKVAEREYDAVFGSRKVVKDVNSPNQAHYYGSDLWSEWGKSIEDRIPNNVIVYGEVVGWTKNSRGDATPIQKGFTYAEPTGKSSLYVYRVSIITDGGELYDLSWDQVRTFCHEHGLNHVPELWRGFKKDFDLEAFKEKDFWGAAMAQSSTDSLTYADDPVPLSNDGTGADEGIAIRVEQGGRVPLLFKYKNDSFYLHETTELDAGVVDLESAEAVSA